MFLTELTEKAGLPDILEGKSIQPEIVKAIHYINRHYQENLSLEGAAELVHLSRYHFCRLFHEATGATFLEYLYNVRLASHHHAAAGRYRSQMRLCLNRPSLPGFPGSLRDVSPKLPEDGFIRLRPHVMGK